MVLSLPASGKSLPFYVAAMEKLVANPRARVIVVYPLKAVDLPVGADGLYQQDGSQVYCLRR